MSVQAYSPAAAAAAPVISDDGNSKIVKGTLVHPDGSPLNHMTLRIGSNLKFQVDPTIIVKTDEGGHFEFNSAALSGNLYLEIIDYPWELHNTSSPERLVKRIEPLPQDLSRIEVSFWEYQKDWPLLRPEQETQQKTTIAYDLALIKGAIAYQGISGALKFADVDSLEAIQSSFNTLGANKTTKLEEEAPGSTHTSKYVASRFFKGMNPGNFLKAKNGDLKIEYNWDRDEFDNQYVLPNAKAYFKLDAEGDLDIYKIKLQYRKAYSGTSAANPPVRTKKGIDKTRLEKRITYQQNDKNFAFAIKRFINAYLTAAEIDLHLATHINLEQYAVASFRNERKNNPHAELAWPFLREVVMVNKLGSTAIFGPTGALVKTTALTASSVDKRLKRVIGSMEYLDWKPRSPLSPKDDYAHAANLYWEILKGFVRDEIEKNKSLLNERENLSQINLFAKDLLDHSLPYHRRDGKKRDAWVDPSETAPSSAPRELYNGKKRALTSLFKAENSSEMDWEKLIQVTAYAIFHATFGHGRVHDLQDEDVGNKNWGVLGEDPIGHLPAPGDLIEQLTLAKLLPNVKYGYIIANEEGDIPQEFIDRLLVHEEQFLKFNHKIRETRSKINI